MPSKRIRPDVLTEQLAGREVARVSVTASGGLVLHFADAGALFIEPSLDGLAVTLQKPAVTEDPARGALPTPRQREYLAFITKYMLRYGRSPAEADICRHFLLSAPSVNSMVQALERRGFITRQPGVPRSIRVSFDVSHEATSGAPSARPRARGKG